MLSSSPYGQDATLSAWRRSGQTLSVRLTSHPRLCSVPLAKARS